MVYATLIWSSREIEILLMFAGQMGCEALNFLLKRLIKQERPKRIIPIEPIPSTVLGLMHAEKK